ncbi:MAG: hypothetical protein KA007_00800 [Candidatus Pacebacteria bacterium]|jgi:Na+/H+ antiporter NhaC|nr:hypothetical protein [Candidatus Paceibacterota bacterium]
MGIIKEDNSNFKTRYEFTRNRFFATFAMLILALGAYIYIEYNYHVNFEQATQNQYDSNYEEN